MHEIGHNLNFAHSGGLDARTYTDHTCLMGNPLFEDDIARMCFNPVKNYQIAANGGWYRNERVAHFDSGTAGGTSWSGRLVGVADYATSRHPVVLRLATGNRAAWFLGFNRAVGANAETQEAADEVTIYRVRGGGGRSYSLSRLLKTLRGGRSVTVSNWRKSRMDLVITVRDIVWASPAYADIEVRK